MKITIKRKRIIYQIES